MPSIHQCVGRGKYVLNRGTFEGRTVSDVEKPIAIFQPAPAIGLGDIQRDRLTGTEPLVVGVTMDAIKQLCGGER